MDGNTSTDQGIQNTMSWTQSKLQDSEEYFMSLALEQAYAAMNAGEVPVGAVIVHGRDVIAAAYNLTETTKNPTAHAEILCIEAAAKQLGDWRIGGSLYVTLEPCLMCYGAMVIARIERLIWGAINIKDGAISKYKLNILPAHGQILQQQCTQLLKKFFGNLRE